jgi:hypothetical protein
MERAQAKMLGNCKVTIVDTAARLSIDVACSWRKPLVKLPTLRQTHAAQMDYN